MPVKVTGDDRVLQMLDRMPDLVKTKLRERITAMIEGLAGAVRAATPYKTGKLRSEISSRVFSDKPGRVAGYVSVQAAGNVQEILKAATLEYGSHKWRAAVRAGGSRKDKVWERLTRGKKRIRLRLDRSRKLIVARMYLRGPMRDMSGEMLDELADAVDQAVQEADEG
jgi:hypothetical protein